MSGHVNVNGTWKNLKTAYAKVNGQWKEIKTGYAKINGTWKQIFTTLEPLNFTMNITGNTVSSKSKTVQLSNLTTWHRNNSAYLRNGVKSGTMSGNVDKIKISSAASGTFTKGNCTATMSGKNYSANELSTGYKDTYQGTYTKSTVFPSSEISDMVKQRFTINISSSQDFDFTMSFAVIGAGFNTCVFDIFHATLANYRYNHATNTVTLLSVDALSGTSSLYPISSRTSVPIEWNLWFDTFSGYGGITIYPYNTLT